MITKAIIKSRILNSNKYYVRIPYFEQANVKNNNLTDSFFEATLSQTPGFINSYNEGDVVFVSFEDSKASKPVILGKLFLDKEESRGFLKANSLTVDGSVILPVDTVIGDFKFKNMYGTLENLKNISVDFEDIGNSVAEVQTEVETLEQHVSDIDNDVVELQDKVEELEQHIGNPIEIIDIR